MKCRKLIRMIPNGVVMLGCLFFGAFSAKACNQFTVTIICPDPGNPLRGPAAGVFVTIATNYSLIDRVALYYDDVIKDSCITTSPKPSSATWQSQMCTFEMSNITKTVKVKAWLTNGDMAMATQTNPIDNAYIISVGRSQGTVRWKYFWYNSWVGMIWKYCVSGHEDTLVNYLDYPWDALTQGGANGYCTGACGHGTPHSQCHNGDTPPYVKSDPNNERSYPTVVSQTDYTCDSNYGTAKINLPTAYGSCGCERIGIAIHGDKVGSSCPSYQDLAPTLGCVRMHNADVETLRDVVAAAQGRIGYSNIHVSVQ